MMKSLLEGRGGRGGGGGDGGRGGGEGGAVAVSSFILSAVNTVVLTETLTCFLLKSTLELQRNSEEFFSIHVLKHI